MRLVDADYIKESVKRQCDNCRKEGMKRMADSVERAIIEELDNTPTAQPQWIPCSERLPEKNGRYLVTNSAWGVWEVDWNAWAEGQWIYPNTKPIAWMPLPKPYGGECVPSVATSSNFCPNCGADMRGESDE